MKQTQQLFTKTTTALSLFAASLVQIAQADTVKNVTFVSEGQTIAGHLYLPDEHSANKKLPAVVITGAWTSVKEQMSANYAKELADKGYAALTFDFRGWGESQGEVKYLESPDEKIIDINAAVDFLKTVDVVDVQKIAGLGICASAGYMSDVAASNTDIKSFALVAPWLHNADIVNQVYGGTDAVRGLISLGENAGMQAYIEAASATNADSLMYQVPYYTETSRGAIPEYDNKFNLASWGPWLTYDAIKTASQQQTPGLLVHSPTAAIPQGAELYANEAGDNIKLVMLDNVTQFDFYDTPDIVSTSVTLIDEHFSVTF